MGNQRRVWISTTSTASASFPEKLNQYKSDVKKSWGIPPETSGMWVKIWETSFPICGS